MGLDVLVMGRYPSPTLTPSPALGRSPGPWPACPVCPRDEQGYWRGGAGRRRACGELRSPTTMARRAPRTAARSSKLRGRWRGELSEGRGFAASEGPECGKLSGGRTGTGRAAVPGESPGTGGADSPRPLRGEKLRTVRKTSRPKTSAGEKQKKK